MERIRTLLYAYGGFNVTVPAELNPLRLALLEQGFVYASANLRGAASTAKSGIRRGSNCKSRMSLTILSPPPSG